MDVLIPHTLSHVDHAIFMAIENEDRRQHENLELIATENYARNEDQLQRQAL